MRLVIRVSCFKTSFKNIKTRDAHDTLKILKRKYYCSKSTYKMIYSKKILSLCFLFFFKLKACLKQKKFYFYKF